MNRRRLGALVVILVVIFAALGVTLASFYIGPETPEELPRLTVSGDVVNVSDGDGPTFDGYVWYNGYENLTAHGVTVHVYDVDGELMEQRCIGTLVFEGDQRPQRNFSITVPRKPARVSLSVESLESEVDVLGLKRDDDDGWWVTYEEAPEEYRRDGAC